MKNIMLIAMSFILAFVVGCAGSKKSAPVVEQACLLSNHRKVIDSDTRLVDNA